MPHNINRFITEINRSSILQSSKYEITISPPPVLAGATISTLYGPQKTTETILSEARFFASDTNIPGVIFGTSEVRRDGLGPSEKKPFAPGFTDVFIRFIVDGNGQILSFFHAWMNAIYNFSTADQSNQTRGFSYNLQNELTYKNDYVSNITIIPYTVTGKEAMGIQLIEAFPVFINDTPLSWAATNNPMKITVGFSFRTWNTENVEVIR